MSLEVYEVNIGEFPIAAQKIFFPVVLGLIAFIIYWFTYQSKSVKAAFDKKYKNDSDLSSEKFIFFAKTLGGLVMGLFPLIVCLIIFPDTNLSDYGLIPDADHLPISLIWLVGLALLMATLSHQGAKKPKHWETYPQMRCTVWDRRRKIKNGLAWTIYLFGYEVLFRGVMLFGLIDVIGFWPTVAINIAMYSGTHIPKGITETVGAIPLSILFCWISLQCGNMWPVAIAHVFMACSSYLTVVRKNPELIEK